MDVLNLKDVDFSFEWPNFEPFLGLAWGDYVHIQGVSKKQLQLFETLFTLYGLATIFIWTKLSEIFFKD